jgi:hypothetical protein
MRLLEIATVRSAYVLSAVQRTASSFGRPLIVRLGVSRSQASQGRRGREGFSWNSRDHIARLYDLEDLWRELKKLVALVDVRCRREAHSYALLRERCCCRWGHGEGSGLGANGNKQKSKL